MHSNGSKSSDRNSTSGPEQFESQEAELAERETALEARATELTHVRVQALAEQEARLRERAGGALRLGKRSSLSGRPRWTATARRGPSGASGSRNAKPAVEARHRELDHRQGELYQAIEEFSAEKAGFGDRTAEIDRREQQVAQWEARLESQVAALDAQTQSLRDRAGELEMERAELRHRIAELAGREKELAAAEKQLAFRQQEITTALERFERLGVTEKRMRELEAEAAEFAARRRYLDEAESQLAQEKSELAEQVRELDRQRRQFQETTARQQRLHCWPGTAVPQRAAAARRAAQPTRDRARQPRGGDRADCAASCGTRNAKRSRCGWRPRRLGTNSRARSRRRV